MKPWTLLCMLPCFALLIAHGAAPRATASSTHAIMEMLLLDDDMEGTRKELTDFLTLL